MGWAPDIEVLWRFPPLFDRLNGLWRQFIVPSTAGDSPGKGMPFRVTDQKPGSCVAKTGVGSNEGAIGKNGERSPRNVPFLQVIGNIKDSFEHLFVPLGTVRK
jgi:hypothetical protein